MPPLMMLAGALGGAALIRWVYRAVRVVNQELEEARRAQAMEAVRRNEIPTLRRDPATGAYRPG